MWVTEGAAMRREYLRVAFARIVAEDGHLSEIVLREEIAPLFHHPDL